MLDFLGIMGIALLTYIFTDIWLSIKRIENEVHFLHQKSMAYDAFQAKCALDYVQLPTLSGDKNPTSKEDIHHGSR